MIEKELAFPCLETDSIGNPLREHLGLTKREYFAGLAMQGMISSNQNLNLSIEEAQCIASQSVQFADELLKQLDNEPTTNI